MDSSCSTSKIPNWGQTSSHRNVDHYEDVVRSFQSFDLRENRTFEEGSTSNSDKNYYNSSKSLNSNQIAYKRFLAQQTPVQTHCFSKNSVSDSESIWGTYKFFVHEGDSFGTGKISGSTSNIHNHEHDYFLNETWGQDIKNNGRYCYNNYDLIDNDLDCTFWRNLGGPQINELKSFISMTTLIDACEGERLDLLISTISCESEFFIKAAFCKEGVIAITKLIRRVKKTHHAFTLTRVLSTNFMDLTTNSIAREVIEKCFLHFSHECNEILYEKAIMHCNELAIHEVGCRSLNGCLSTIAAEQRSILLTKIADVAVILSDDRYGNYVLQNVIELNYTNLNERIFESLRGQFISLAQRKAGSHTIETCMKTETGLRFVLGELLRNPQIAPTLAQQRYGNYVIQKALRMTRGHGLFMNAYYALVNFLEPHFQLLGQTTGGRNVINIIEEND